MQAVAHKVTERLYQLASHEGNENERNEKKKIVVNCSSTTSHRMRAHETHFFIEFLNIIDTMTIPAKCTQLKLHLFDLQISPIDSKTTMKTILIYQFEEYKHLVNEVSEQLIRDDRSRSMTRQQITNTFNE